MINILFQFGFICASILFSVQHLFTKKEDKTEVLLFWLITIITGIAIFLTIKL